MRRFKAQDIKTSQPKSKQNFLYQQTQATYNMYKLSSKTRADKKPLGPSGGSLSQNKSSAGPLASKTLAAGEPRKKVDPK